MNALLSPAKMAVHVEMALTSTYANVLLVILASIFRKGVTLDNVQSMTMPYPVYQLEISIKN